MTPSSPTGVGYNADTRLDSRLENPGISRNFSLMDLLLEPILQSPRFPEYLGELQRVAREEAERRRRFYEEMTPEQKVEFINGEVLMHSPANAKHIQITRRLSGLIGTFVGLNELGWVGVEKALISLTRNDYEPEICFFDRETAAGFADNQMKFPAPSFVVEVLSPSTAKVDRGVKFNDYAAHGVREYWIIDPEPEIIEQYLLNADGAYELEAKVHEGIIESRAIPGFRIPSMAAFREADNLVALKQWME